MRNEIEHVTIPFLTGVLSDNFNEAGTALADCVTIPFLTGVLSDKKEENMGMYMTVTIPFLTGVLSDKNNKIWTQAEESQSPS